MGLLIVLGSAVAGFVLGGVGSGDGTAGFGFFVGLAFGLLWHRQRMLDARIERLHARIGALHPRGAGAETSAESAHRAPSTTPTPPVIDTHDLPQPPPLNPRDDIPNPQPVAVPPEPVAARAAVAPPAAGATRSAPPRGPSVADRMRRWFTDGNVPVKIGMLVLFAGVAALLKHASDQGWLRLPIELRLAGVALAAIGALAFGWRQRIARHGFGLVLQGGAIGILLLVVFAAFRLYHLLPAGAAFALMLVLVAGAGLLAVLQDAKALAVLGILAGFAAPILISTGSGNHVVLFAYYAMLNLAILAIAWHKDWRALNLLGFFCTYAIGTAWGVLRYEPKALASTEPFLLLFYAIHLAIPLLTASRGDPQRRNLVDGTLVFGNPLVAFALQAALLDGARMPLAYCALALAMLYALLAWWLIPRRRMLGESFAVLAAGFATLAVPLALSARTTACAFALEGAGLVWLGLRQQQRLPRIAGLALQGLAALTFAASYALRGNASGELPFANGAFAGALLIAIAGFASALAYARASGWRIAIPAWLWGVAWWCGAGLIEIECFAPDRLKPAATLAFVAVSAWLAAFAFRRTRYSAPAWTSALALAASVPVALSFGEFAAQPFAGWSIASLGAYALGGWFSLHLLRDADRIPRALAQAGWIWAWTALASVALQRAAIDAGLGNGWVFAALAAPLVAAWAVTMRKPGLIAPPMRDTFLHHRSVLLASQALTGALAFVLSLPLPGASTPLPFVPLLNPLELAQLALLACLFRWLGDSAGPAEIRGARPVLLTFAGFAFVTAATLHGAHHLGGVPWDETMASSHLVQTALTIVWSILGVVGWVIGSRRGSRALWLAGAVLMGIVLAKLLIVDRGHLGNLFGIVSFIAYGLLCTVIGYLAPAPPRAASPESEAS